MYKCISLKRDSRRWLNGFHLFEFIMSLFYTDALNFFDPLNHKGKIFHGKTEDPAESYQTTAQDSKLD